MIQCMNTAADTLFLATTRAFAVSIRTRAVRSARTVRAFARFAFFGIEVVRTVRGGGDGDDRSADEQQLLLVSLFRGRGRGHE